MTELCGAEEDRFLRPGTLVRLSIKVNNFDMLEPESGVVLRCWRNAGRGTFECLVAFVGEDFGDEAQLEEPYLSVFAATSLAEVDPDDQQWPM